MRAVFLVIVVGTGPSEDVIDRLGIGYSFYRH